MQPLCELSQVQMLLLVELQLERKKLEGRHVLLEQRRKKNGVVSVADLECAQGYRETKRRQIIKARKNERGEESSNTARDRAKTC